MSSATDAPLRFSTADQNRGVEVELRVELGSKRYTLTEITSWQAGTMVLLDKKIGTPLDIYANEQHIGKGRAINRGGRIAVEITELIQPQTAVE